jgi:glycosyltransferase involved in cell wall biosynthesis
MKLLFLTEFFPRTKELVFTGGVEARTYYVVKQAQKEFPVKIIASSSRQVPATPLSVFTRLFFLVISFFKALRLEFDLIEASNVVTYLPAYWAAKVRKKPVIIWVPDVLGRNWLDFGWIVGLSGWLMEKLYLRLNWDGVIALSDSTKQKLVKSGIKTKHLGVIYGGIEPKEFKLVAIPEKFMTATVCCVARLVATKRLEVLIKAMALLPGQIKARLVIIGRGPRRQYLLKQVRYYRLDEQVKFIDYLPRRELVETLFRSRIFCLPSVVEGFGLATIEAMACGLPCVLANIPVNQEVTDFGKGALFFKPGRENELAKQLERLLTDKKLYRQKQLEALKLSRNYSWQNVYQQTKRFYETCLHH